MNFLRFVLVTLVFSAFAAAQNNPVPFLDQPLYPVSGVPGGSGFTLMLRGAGFVSGAVANWNGTALATTFVSRAELTANVPASEIAVPGSASVTVSNPSPGGGTSNVVFFPVATPVPSLQFASQGLLPGYTFYFSPVATADFNDDGNLDIAIEVYSAATGLNSLAVLLGNGDGTFHPPAIYPVSQYENFGIVAGDFNNDGKLDLVTGQYIRLGNGDGTFQPVQPINLIATPVSAGDFNEDGNLDLLEQYGGGLYLALGNGDGTFQPLAPPFYPGQGSFAAADFNNDGHLDIADLDLHQTTVLLGNGAGTFSPGAVFSGSLGDGGAADVNGDGNQDLFLSTYSSHNVEFGNGDGTFSSGPNFLPQCGLHTETGDFNVDGKLDLIGDCTILLGNGDGTFQRVPLSSYVEVLAIGDFNGDGRLDLVTVNVGGQSETFNVALQVVQPAVTLAPSSLKFSNQAVGNTSNPQAITLTNSGNSTLSITSIGITGANASEFTQTNTCGASLAVGASCKINVTFTPTAVGTPSAAVSVADNAVDSPQTVALTGTVEDFSMSGSPTSVTVTPGQAANYMVTASPVNGFNQSIAFTCSGNPAGSTCTVRPSSVTLDGTNNATASVAVVTAGASAGLSRPDGLPSGGGSGLWLAMAGGLGVGGLVSLRGKNRARRRAAAGLLCVLAIALMPACGGSSGGGGGTQTGTYTVVVTGTYTAGTATLTHTAKMTLVVQ